MLIKCIVLKDNLHLKNSILIKAFGKKDISKLVRKKVMTRSTPKSKAHITTVFVNEDKDKKEQKHINIPAYKGMLFEEALTVALNGENLDKFFNSSKYYNALPSPDKINMKFNIKNSVGAMKEYFKNNTSSIKKVSFVGGKTGLGYKADIVIKYKNRDQQISKKAFSDLTKAENLKIDPDKMLGVSLKTVQAKTVKSAYVKLYTTTTHKFVENELKLNSQKEIKDLSDNELKHKINKLVPKLFEDKRYPDMQIFLADLIRKQYTFLKESKLVHLIIRKIKKGTITRSFHDDGTLRSLKFSDKEGKTILRIERVPKRESIFLSTPYEVITNLANKYK